ncbi:MAG: transporter permease [Betaproteobacteria bacterium]|nr:transporter permease [Betaproteobacteria bacterium]
MNRRHFNGLLAGAAAMGALPRLAHAENGIDAGTILLGQSCPLTGPAAELGTEMRLGAQLYFTEINKKGGIFGRSIKLTTLDDGYEPDRAAANTRKLIEEEKVFALFGYVGTPTSNAALPIFTKAQVPFFGAFTGAESLRNPFNRNIFNIRASYFDETEKIVEQLTNLGIKSIGVLYQNDAYGQAGLAGVTRALTKRGMRIAAQATVERNTVAVDPAVKLLVPAQPDVIVMISAYKSIAAFVKASKKAGYVGQFHNVSFVGSRALANELGPEGNGVAISQVVPFPYAASIAIVREYQQALKAGSTAAISFTSLEGYLAARVFTEGLRRAGKDLTRDKLIAAFETMRNVDFGGFNINFTPENHNGSSFVELTIIGRDNNFIH